MRMNRLTCAIPKSVAQLFQNAALNMPLAGAQNRHRELVVRWQRDDSECRQRPINRLAGEEEPSAQEHHERSDFRQAAAQVVQNLPARNHRQRIRRIIAEEVRHARQQPENDLPIATHPAVLAAAERAHVRRIIVNNFDVRYQTGASVRAFNKVVAQNHVAREAVLHDLLERFDFVDSLTGEAAFAEQILINVRSRARVNVETRVRRENRSQAANAAPNRC